MSQAMMFRDSVNFRAILQTLGAQINVQDAQGDPESAAALLSRLHKDDGEDVRAIPELLVAGINRDGGVVFIKTRLEKTQSRPIAINLNVPPPERFRIVPYDPSAISELLGEHMDTP